MKRKNKSKKQKQKEVIIVLLFISSMLFLYMQFSTYLNSEFLNDGIEIEATAQSLNKRMVSNGRGMSEQSFVKVAFFTKSAEELADTIPFVLDTATLDFEQQVDAILDNIKVHPIGSYVSTEIPIPDKMYDTIKVKNKISIYYLPTNPEDARVKVLTDNFDNSPGYYIFGFILSGLLLAWLIIVRKQ